MKLIATKVFVKVVISPIFATLFFKMLLFFCGFLCEKKTTNRRVTTPCLVLMEYHHLFE